MKPTDESYDWKRDYHEHREAAELSLKKGNPGGGIDAPMHVARAHVFAELSSAAATFGAAVQKGETDGK